MACFPYTWAFQTDYYEGGSLDYYATTCNDKGEMDNGIETAKISPI
jgi:hypothetical protein